MNSSPASWFGVILLGVATAVSLVPVAKAALTDQLTNYWSFDTDYTAGTGGVHLSPGGGSGTAPSLTSGWFGNAAIFDGSNDWLTASVPTGNGLRVNGGSFTLVFWAYIQAHDNGYQRLVSIGQTTSSYSPGVLVGKSRTGYDGGKVWADFYTPSTSASSVTLNPLPGSSTWRQFALVADSVSRSHTLFVDGAAQVGDTFRPLTLTGSTNLTLGHHPYLASLGFDRYFHGGIDELAVWNRALSTTELAALRSTPLSALIPEPSALAMLVGAVAVLLRRRR